MASLWFKPVTVTGGYHVPRRGRRARRRVKLQSVPWNGAAAVPRGELIKPLAGKASNDCIPHNPCTVIFTSKEPPIGSCSPGWNSPGCTSPRASGAPSAETCAQTHRKPRSRTFNGERESDTDRGFCSLVSYGTFSTIPKHVWEEKSDPTSWFGSAGSIWGGFPGRVCVLGGFKGDLGCVQAEAVAASCSGGTAFLSASAVLHRNEID